jgi:hypothetical protein
MCRDDRLKPQTLKGQAFCRIWEKEFQRFEKNGISGESSAQSVLHDRSVAFRGTLARNHVSSDERF